ESNQRRRVTIVTSDHGDLGGAHGLPFKGPALYEELVRVPLVITGLPGFTAGECSNRLASHIDIVPTLAQVAEIQWPEPMAGMALTRRSEREAVRFEYYGKQFNRFPIRGIRTTQFKYTHYTDTSEYELYDLACDPNELTNLANDDRYRNIREELNANLIR